MDGIFYDRWGLWILVGMVFGIFSKRLAKKHENGIEAPQTEISLEGVFSSDMPWADVKGHIVEVPFLRIIDQPGSLLVWECVEVIVGDE